MGNGRIVSVDGLADGDAGFHLGFCHLKDLLLEIRPVEPTGQGIDDGSLLGENRQILLRVSQIEVHPQDLVHQFRLAVYRRLLAHQNRLIRTHPPGLGRTAVQLTHPDKVGGSWKQLVTYCASNLFSCFV